MLHDEKHQRIDVFTSLLVRRKARQIIGRAGLTPQDRADIEQELWAWIKEREPAFDAQKAHWNPFVTCLVDRAIANVLRGRRAQKRGRRPNVSLSILVSVGDEGPVELAQTISERQLTARLGRRARSDDELAQLTTDLAEVVGRLPPHLGELAERLKSQNVAEAAREMDIPRTTAHDWVRRIRVQFESAGLRDYL